MSWNARDATLTLTSVDNLAIVLRPCNDCVAGSDERNDGHPLRFPLRIAHQKDFSKWADRFLEEFLSSMKGEAMMKLLEA